MSQTKPAVTSLITGKSSLIARLTKATCLLLLLHAPLHAWEYDDQNTKVFSPSVMPRESNTVSFDYGARLDRNLEQDIVRAKRAGFKVILQPKIITDPLTAKVLKSQKEWIEWFYSYERMVCYFANIAYKTNVDMFVVGTEYEKATRGRDREWRRIIHSVQAIYRGPITYIARGYDEAEWISFWDELDLIGINVNFSNMRASKPEEQKLFWAGHRTNLGVLSKRNNDKPLLLIYAGTADAVFLDAFRNQSWVQGVIIGRKWKN